MMEEYIDFEDKDFVVRDFYLTSLERRCQVNLIDSEAKIIRGTTPGRIFLDVEEDALGNLFDWFFDHKDVVWEGEKTLLQTEIQDPRAQLQRALTEPDQPPVQDNSLKWELDTVRAMLSDAQRDLKLQTDMIRTQDDLLARAKLDYQTLQKETEGKIAQLRAAAEIPAVTKTDKDLDLESCLQTERALTKKLKGQLIQMKDLMQQQTRTHQIHLEEQKAATRKLSIALRESAFQAKVNRLQREDASFQQKCELNEAKWVAQRAEAKRLMAARKRS